MFLQSWFGLSTSLHVFLYFLTSRLIFAVDFCYGMISFFTRESSYCFQRVLAIAILSVRPSVTRVDKAKRSKLGSPNLHRRLPGRL